MERRRSSTGRQTQGAAIAALTPIQRRATETHYAANELFGVAVPQNVLVYNIDRQVHQMDNEFQTPEFQHSGIWRMQFVIDVSAGEERLREPNADSESGNQTCRPQKLPQRNSACTLQIFFGRERGENSNSQHGSSQDPYRLQELAYIEVEPNQFLELHEHTLFLASDRRRCRFSLIFGEQQLIPRCPPDANASQSRYPWAYWSRHFAAQSLEAAVNWVNHAMPHSRNDTTRTQNNPYIMPISTKYGVSW